MQVGRKGGFERDLGQLRTRGRASGNSFLQLFANFDDLSAATVERELAGGEGGLPDG